MGRPSAPGRSDSQAEERLAQFPVDGLGFGAHLGRLRAPVFGGLEAGGRPVLVSPHAGEVRPETFVHARQFALPGRAGVTPGGVGDLRPQTQHLVLLGVVLHAVERLALDGLAPPRRPAARAHAHHLAPAAPEAGFGGQRRGLVLRDPADLGQPVDVARQVLGLDAFGFGDAVRVRRAHVHVRGMALDHGGRVGGRGGAGLAASAE